MRPMKQTLLGLGAMVGLLTVNLVAPGAQAQQTSPLCNARTTVLKTLDGNYAEKPSAMGLASNGTVVEILKSKEDSWTIIMTAPRVACTEKKGFRTPPRTFEASGLRSSSPAPLDQG